MNARTFGTYEDIYDFFACARSHADPYPAKRLAAQRAGYVAAMHELGAGDHEPQTTGDCTSLAYGDCNLLEARRNEILEHYKEATPEEQNELIDELAEIENETN